MQVNFWVLKSFPKLTKKKKLNRNQWIKSNIFWAHLLLWKREQNLNTLGLNNFLFFKWNLWKSVNNRSCDRYDFKIVIQFFIWQNVKLSINMSRSSFDWIDSDKYCNSLPSIFAWDNRLKKKTKWNLIIKNKIQIIYNNQ